MPSPYVPLPHIGTSSNNRSESSGSDLILLNYGDNQLLDISSWDGVFHVLSLFGTKETSSKDATNILTSLIRIGNYIKNHLVGKIILSGDFVPVIKSL